MKPERWQRVKALYDRARRLSREEAESFLITACGDDEELRLTVVELLDADPEGFLDTPPLAGVTNAAATRDPQRLGGFEISERIGSGAFGVVYRAYEPALDREVAVKVLPPSLTLDARDVTRFEREARAIAKLRHPGIVAVHAVGREGDTSYFAMDLIEGENLHFELERLRGKLTGESRLPSDEREYTRTVARLVAEAAEALQHAHDHGIVHRDVKPANLLLDEDLHVQVVDFGLARDEELGHITASGERAGTPYYMSPEQVRAASADVDHRTDVYSLGVVLYELLTLEPPFNGRTYPEILSDVVHREAVPARRMRLGLPRDLDTICARAMEKVVDERYPDAAALRDDLTRWLEGRPIVARPWSPPERALRWLRANRRHVVAVASVLLALGVGYILSSELLAARSKARLDLALVDGDGRAVDGSVVARALGPVLGVPGDVQELGRLPLRGARLEPGDYRLEVRDEHGGARTLMRTLEAGRTTSLNVTRRATHASTEGMVLIEGGTLALRDADAPLLAINGRDIVVESFWIDRCEVTNAEYRRFLAATDHPPPDQWDSILPEVHDELPVVYVGWEEARAYAEWAGKRLPSFVEWNWAARGAEGRLYPWPDAVPGELRGNCARPLEAVQSSEYLLLYLRSVVPVRSQPEACTASGLFHMFGNVAEWTESPAYEPSYSSEGGFEPRPHSRLVAGHAWADGTGGHTLSTFSFAGQERTWADHGIGFRCAQSAASHNP